jgi:hypothetical protein
LSHDLQLNCMISFYFRLYLMLHACAVRFDVTENLENFFRFWGELNKAHDALHLVTESCWGGCRMPVATPWVCGPSVRGATPR